MPRCLPLASLLTSAVLALGSAAPAAVLQVPATYPSIQAALLAATPGDVVLVAPGTYRENIVWPNVDGIRLVSEGGYGVTTIDGGAQGRVITFDVPLSRITVLSGFTITGGLLNDSTYNSGAGIWITGQAGPCSPTIRDNRIAGNRCVDGYENRGAGLALHGPCDPRIERNLIEQNEIEGGDFAFGGGLFLGDDARADILSNVFRDNRIAERITSLGAGMAMGLDFGDGTVVAGNIFSANECQAVTSAKGAGLHIYPYGSGTRTPRVVVTNNTFADNVVRQNAIGNGAAFYVGSTVEVVFCNNIVAYNEGGAAVSQIGTNVVAADYNTLWSNSVGGYSNISAGPNDLFVDPRFIDRVDLRLELTSPCIDAGSNTWLHTLLAQDVDGDPRRLDGDLDGTAGNGATVDMGADEAARVGLDATGAPALGTVLTLDTSGFVGGAYALLFSQGTGRVFIDPLGIYLLSGATVIDTGAVPGSAALPIPNVPALRGVGFHVQGLVYAAPHGSFTRRLDFIIH